MGEPFMLNCRKCGRLVCDVSDKSMLPNVLQCQHCHHNNIIRRKNEEPEEPREPPTEPVVLREPVGPPGEGPYEEPPVLESGEDTGESSGPGEDTGTEDTSEEEN